MKLILIHGRSQQNKDPFRLRQDWIQALTQGFESASLSLPIDEGNIEFLYYGDMLQSILDGAAVPIEGIIARGITGDEPEAAFIFDMLQEMAENAGISDEEIEEYIDTTVTEKGPLNWGWVQGILRAIDAKNGWGESAVKLFTRDVFLYLSKPGINTQINKWITNAVSDEPCVVVGHSLGTVISYNVLRNAPGKKVTKYITLGSPLGLTAVKKYLQTPLMMPPCVKTGWYNAYDDRDVVALNTLDDRHFKISPSIVNKSNVNNHTKNRHGIEGYLNDADVALQIYEGLTFKDNFQ